MVPGTAADACLIVDGSREARMLAEAIPDARLVAILPDAPGIRAVIDASHPCEREAHARVAALCAARGLPLLRYLRPGWEAGPGDDWRRVPDGSAARAALDPAWRRVFLCLGRGERAPFAGDTARHYLVRTRRDDPAAEGLVDFTLTAKGGPFAAREEAGLMRAERIDALVTRDAGGKGAWPKMAGARALGLPVVLVDRPPVACPVASSVEEARAWLASL